MQIILIICKDISLAVFPALADCSIQGTIFWLQNIQISRDYYMTFGICFSLLKEKAQSPALKQIFDGLMYFLYLGYLLNDVKPYAFRFDLRSTTVPLKSLEEKDAELFAAELQHLTCDIFQAGKEKLIAGGIQEANAIVLPPDYLRIYSRAILPFCLSSVQPAFFPVQKQYQTKGYRGKDYPKPCTGRVTRLYSIPVGLLRCVFVGWILLCCL